MAAKKPPASTPARTTSPAGAEAGQSTTALARELRSLIPRLDAEGLQFLIEQAQVHLYNMQVDELNRSRESMAAAKTKTAKARGQSAAGDAEEIRIEGAEGSGSFYIVYRGNWVIFSRDEIAQMLRILSAPLTGTERRTNLFNWIVRERRDLFAVIPMADPADRRLKKIAELLTGNFRLQKPAGKNTG